MKTEVGSGSPGPTLLAAQRLVACGSNVIPLRPGEKTPAVRWERFQRERLVDRDWDEVDRYLYSWWGGDKDHGLGVVTGAVSEIVVVDVDSDEARSLVERTCGWPRTVTTRTAKGWHLWFRYPGETRNGVRRGESALDVRGDGGYVVVPPSRHPSGVEYTWAVSPFTFSGGMWPPAPLPGELAALLWPARPSVDDRGTAAPILTSKYVAVALEREVAAVASSPVGARNDQLNRSAFKVARFVRSGQLSAVAVAEAFVDAARRAGLSDHEAERTVESALRGALA